MPTLPAHPNLDQLRRQARDLLRAANGGDDHAIRRIEAVSDRLTLSSAQLAVARDHGFASWPRLKSEVEARTVELSRAAVAFCGASVGDWTGRAARILAARPEIADYSVETAAVLGGVERVRSELERDRGLATRRDPDSGWTALHLACGSKWHHLDPTRADGLAAVAELLLDAGAELDGRIKRPGGRDGRSPLECACATASTSAGNEPLARLLLERGAVPGDHDLYMVAFAQNRGRCLALLLDHTQDVGETARMALAAPISTGDTEIVRVMLEAGVDPRRYHDDDDRPSSAAYAAVSRGCSAALLGLLLAHEADPSALGPDGRSPIQLATAQGWDDLAQLLLRYGAVDDATDADRLRSACLRSDHDQVKQQLAEHPALLHDTVEALGGTIVHAAETGNMSAVSLMLDLGYPLEAHVGEDGGTVLHTAAYAGTADTVRLLLDRGATSRPAIRGGTAHRLTGPRSEAASNPHKTLPRTGWQPSERCSKPAPPPKASHCHPANPSRRASRSPNSCAATASVPEATPRPRTPAAEMRVDIPRPACRSRSADSGTCSASGRRADAWVVFAI
jgi:ankyrin repeat protein